MCISLSLVTEGGVQDSNGDSENKLRIPYALCTVLKLCIRHLHPYSLEVGTILFPHQRGKDWSFREVLKPTLGHMTMTEKQRGDSSLSEPSNVLSKPQ